MPNPKLKVLNPSASGNAKIDPLMALFCAGGLVPEIDCVLPAVRAREAWERLEAQEQMGKIVLDWS